MEEQSKLPLCLRVEDVARLMGIGRNSALDLVHSEGFPVIKVGRRLIIPRDRFFNWLNGQTEPV